MSGGDANVSLAQPTNRLSTAIDFRCQGQQSQLTCCGFEKLGGNRGSRGKDTAGLVSADESRIRIEKGTLEMNSRNHLGSQRVRCDQFGKVMSATEQGGKVVGDQGCQKLTDPAVGQFAAYLMQLLGSELVVVEIDTPPAVDLEVEDGWSVGSQLGAPGSAVVLRSRLAE